MVRTKTKKPPIPRSRQEPEGIYILKIVLYAILGSQWLRLTDSGMSKQIPIPIGLVIGGFFAVHDHFKIDRKIEYALLLLACLVGFWAQIGLTVILHF